jgi:hypothetical protein
MRLRNITGLSEDRPEFPETIMKQLREKGGIQDRKDEEVIR